MAKQKTRSTQAGASSKRAAGKSKAAETRGTDKKSGTGKKSNPRQTAAALNLPTYDERVAHGKTFRNIVARVDHAMWTPPAKRRDPIDIIEAGNAGRVEELIPYRHGRMMKSPFTFYRGSAAVMASDLSHTPVTGMHVQACGDAHLLNFGAYATPERNVILDINDFDETLPAPWEWDLKRLATSFVLACRENGFKAGVSTDAAETTARSYREAMIEFSRMKVLDVWYSKMDVQTFMKRVSDDETRKDIMEYAAKQKDKSSLDYMIPRLTVEENGTRRFKDIPPFVYHSEEQHDKKFMQIAQETFTDYKQSLSHAHQILLNRYKLLDVAMKVVGIGSVGTYCAVMLLMAGQDDPLILQVKEARQSVLEPYVQKSQFANHGQRVVVGQRLMQAHSDIFLGWTMGTGKYHRHFYIRQLKDQKMSLLPETWSPGRAIEVAEALGWVLARAHARSADAAMIAGYLGMKDVFDKAIVKFAVAYADQAERDHAALVAAVKSGRLEAFIER